MNSRPECGKIASIVDSGNTNEYEEEIELYTTRNNAQKLRRGSAVESPLSVLLGMKSMPKIVRGQIIAGDSTNVQVTLLKKLPHLEKKPELPTDYPNYNEKMPPPPVYYPYDDDYPGFDKIPDDDDDIEIGPY